MTAQGSKIRPPLLVDFLRRRADHLQGVLQTATAEESVESPIRLVVTSSPSCRSIGLHFSKWQKRQSIGRVGGESGCVDRVGLGHGVTYIRLRIDQRSGNTGWLSVVAR